MAREDYYAILGVKRDATEAEIKRAYRRLALDSHPDRFPGDADAEERFRKISQAYSILGDASSRSRYDGSLLLPEGLDLVRTPTIGTARDLFNNVFGDILGQRRRERRRGRDNRYTLTIDFEDAVLGSEHTIEFETNGACSTCVGTGTQPDGRTPNTCPVCDGKGEMKSGGLFSRRSTCGRCDGLGMVQLDPCGDCKGRGFRREKRRFDVRISPGTEPGAERVLKGQGEPGRFGGESGNLRVTVNVRDHRWLERKGEDITCELPVSITQVALGDSVLVPTVDGWVTMELPAGVSTGARLRLAGKGVPRSRGGRGDQLVKLVVETPRVGSAEHDELRRLLSALEKESVSGNVLKRRAELLRESKRTAS